MAGCETLQADCQNKPSDDFEDVNKILAVVVQRRKKIPTKCMQINDEIAALEIQNLENAKVVTEQDQDREELKRIFESFNTQNLKSLEITLDDLHEAQRKVEKLHGRMRDINTYLEKRKRPRT